MFMIILFQINFIMMAFVFLKLYSIRLSREQDENQTAVLLESCFFFP